MSYRAERCGPLSGQLTSERREIISNDLESMRDDPGFPIHWDPDTGTYRLGENPKAWPPRPGGRNLGLLFRAIRLEEYLYVSFTIRHEQVREGARAPLQQGTV